MTGEKLLQSAAAGWCAADCWRSMFPLRRQKSHALRRQQQHHEVFLPSRRGIQARHHMLFYIFGFASEGYQPNCSFATHFVTCAGTRHTQGPVSANATRAKALPAILIATCALRANAGSAKPERTERER